MKGASDFMGAALPWIAMGLLPAILFARSVGRKKDGEKRDEHGSEGMALGMCFGTALATALGINVGIGMMAGMVLGLLVGSSIEIKDQRGGKRDENTGIERKPQEKE